MKRYSTTKAILAGAAMAGIVSGGFIAKSNAATVTKVDKTGISAGVLAEKEESKAHDCAGKNTCKGKGGCKSGDKGCAGKNTCKGKGGCATGKDGKPLPPKK